MDEIKANQDETNVRMTAMEGKQDEMKRKQDEMTKKQDEINVRRIFKSFIDFN